MCVACDYRRIEAAREERAQTTDAQEAERLDESIRSAENDLERRMDREEAEERIALTA